jgi:hypothetical protein
MLFVQLLSFGHTTKRTVSISFFLYIISKLLLLKPLGLFSNRLSIDDIIASSHKGPVQVYLAPTKTQGKGPVWIKVASDGLSNGQWATDKLIANKGQHTITMPHLQPGEYLIRPEVGVLEFHLCSIRRWINLAS